MKNISLDMGALLSDQQGQVKDKNEDQQKPVLQKAKMLLKQPAKIVPEKNDYENVKVDKNQYQQFKRMRQQRVQNIINEGQQYMTTLIKGNKKIDQEKLEQAMKQNPDKVFRYVPGQFSKFAARKQKSIQSLDVYIKEITRQAAYSHLLKIRQLMEEAKQFDKKSGSQKILQTIVQPKNVTKAIQDPIDFFSGISLVGENVKFDTFDKMAQNYHSFMTNSKQFAVVQGRFIQRAKLSLQSAFQHTNQETLVPTTSQNVYIRIGNGLIPQKRILKNGQFVAQSALQFLDEKTRGIIYAMVKLYLAQKGLLTQQSKKILKKTVDDYQQKEQTTN